MNSFTAGRLQAIKYQCGWEAAIYCLTLQHHIHHFVYTRYKVALYLKVGVASGYTHLITFGDYSIDFAMVINSPIK